MLSVKSNYSHTSVTPITATMISLALGTFLLGIFCGRDRKRWILYVTMWGGRKLSSSGSRFLGAHRSAFRGTQADCPRLTTSAGECVRGGRSHAAHGAGRLFCAGAGAGGGLSRESARGQSKTCTLGPGPCCP